jgi:hypothetical protein
LRTISIFSVVAAGPSSASAGSPGISFIMRNTTIDTPSSTGTIVATR